MSVSLYKKIVVGVYPSSNEHRTWHIARCKTLLKMKSADEEKAWESVLPKGQQQWEVFFCFVLFFMRLDLVPAGRAKYPCCSILPALFAGVHRASTRKHRCPFSGTIYSSTRQRELCTCSVSLTLCAVAWNGSCRLSGILVEITEEEEKKCGRNLFSVMKEMTKLAVRYVCNGYVL